MILSGVSLCTSLTSKDQSIKIFMDKIGGVLRGGNSAACTLQGLFQDVAWGRGGANASEY